jgi:hypothetical protein
MESDATLGNRTWADAAKQSFWMGVGVQIIEEIHIERVERAVPAGYAAEESLEELLAFERLLSDLSARFANVAGDQVVAEIESALKQLLKFLGFDRSTFSEFTDEGNQGIAPVFVELCEAGVAVNDVKRFSRFGQERGCVLRPGFETSGWAYSGGQL